jgi:hypothetical protein
LCVPSQYGAVFVCLQPQRYTIFGSARENLTGANPVPWWEPSHIGCVFDLPQAHQWYSPAANVTAKGAFWATTGFSMDLLLS